MILVKVENPNFVATCASCVGRIPPKVERYADLDGPAFKAYFCVACTEELNKDGVHNRRDYHYPYEETR